MVYKLKTMPIEYSMAHRYYIEYASKCLFIVTEKIDPKNLEASEWLEITDGNTGKVQMLNIAQIHLIKEMDK